MTKHFSQFADDGIGDQVPCITNPPAQPLQKRYLAIKADGPGLMTVTADELAALHKDAQRWRNCVAFGFPVEVKPTYTKHAGYWFCVRGGIMCQGDTADAAVDEAMRAALREPKP